MKRAGLMVAWLVVAAGLSTIAYQIVAAAESQVSDRPLTPIVAITSSSTTATTGAQPSTTGTEPDSTTSTSAVSDSTTTTVGSTTSTSAASTSTSAPATTSTTPPAAWTSKTIASKGGEVVIQYRPGEVRLVAARPAPGYRVEVEMAGPPEVEVEFESETTEAKSDVRARWRNGALEVTVEE